MRYKATITTLVITALLVTLGIIAYTIILRPSFLNNKSQTQSITLNKEQVLSFGKHDGQEGIYSIEIEVEGTIEPNFELYIGAVEKYAVHRALVKGGNVEYAYVSDWYDDSCYIRVVPKESSNDSLSFSCRFISTN